MGTGDLTVRGDCGEGYGDLTMVMDGDLTVVMDVVTVVMDVVIVVIDVVTVVIDVVIAMVTDCGDGLVTVVLDGVTLCQWMW